MPDPIQVRSMFARIAGRYDLLNRVLSAGLDQGWRRTVLRLAGDVRGRTVVDSCSGTGDLALAFARAGARVVGLDFTPEMLARTPGKLARIRSGRALFAAGDALALPARDGVADVCTVAFGIRNVADRTRALSEMKRVTRPGGRVFVLEFTLPPGQVLGALYRFYFTRVLPSVGRSVSGDDDAYAYLPRSVLAWPSPGELEQELVRAGFEGCGHRLLTRGVACIHWGRVPEAAAAHGARA